MANKLAERISFKREIICATQGLNEAVSKLEALCSKLDVPDEVLYIEAESQYSEYLKALALVQDQESNLYSALLKLQHSMDIDVQRGAPIYNIDYIEDEEGYKFQIKAFLSERPRYAVRSDIYKETVKYSKSRYAFSCSFKHFFAEHPGEFRRFDEAIMMVEFHTSIPHDPDEYDTKVIRDSIAEKYMISMDAENITTYTKVVKDTKNYIIVRLIDKNNAAAVLKYL